MDLAQLKTFLTIAQEGGFTRAAEKLFLTQPAVSLQVKALEEDLGERLFERRGRRVLLTEAGRLLLDQARTILGQVDQARQMMGALKELRTGKLRIGASDTNCAYILTPVVKAFRDAYPGIELQLTDRMSPEVIRLVVEGDIDFGLATLPVDEPRVLAEPLFVRRDVLITPPGHPAASVGRPTAAEVVKHPLLLLERGSTSRVLLDRSFAAEGVSPGSVMELGSIEVIKRFCEIELGIAIVPEVAVQAEASAGKLRVLPLDWLPDREVGVVRRRESGLSPAAEAFLETLRGRFEQVDEAAAELP